MKNALFDQQQARRARERALFVRLALLCSDGYADLHETSRAIQSSRRPRITFRTMSICYVTWGSIAMSRHAFMRRMTRSPKVAPSHRCSRKRRWVESRPRLGVLLLLEHVFTSMQAYARQRRKTHSSINNKHAVRENGPYPCDWRHCAVTAPADLHETSRAIQSSRRPRLTFRTMSICYVTSGSIAMSRHASCVG